MNRYLFYISQNYSFDILRPLQQQILARGDSVAWFLMGSAVDPSRLHEDEHQLHSAEEVKAYNPAAVFVPGNVVPDFFPGIKVQVFHGFEWKKKGHFRIRGFFDLYCTHGRITTSHFNKLAAKHRHFRVVETGWPKMDPLCTPHPQAVHYDRPVVLFAPTFSPSLTSAPALFEQIKALSATGKWQWLVRFHPKMDQQWIDKYSQLAGEHLKIDTASSVIPALQSADVMLSDTSSIIAEFQLLGKPAITLNNLKPGPSLINITQASELPRALESAFAPTDELKKAINTNNQDLHPYQDGSSSARILAATDQLIADQGKGLRKKPLNLLRKLKIRKRLKYYKLR